MNSEIIGLPTTKPWGFIFRNTDGLPRHPAQLYEAICYFSFFLLHMILYKKYGDRLKNGFFFGSAILLIFTARFFIEFVKENQVDFENSMVLNLGQALSIPFAIVGLIFIVKGYRKGRVAN